LRLSSMPRAARTATRATSPKKIISALNGILLPVCGKCDVRCAGCGV
jgi:hypothetical protein